MGLLLPPVKQLVLDKMAAAWTFTDDPKRTGEVILRKTGQEFFDRPHASTITALEKGGYIQRTGDVWPNRAWTLTDKGWKVAKPWVDLED